MTRGNYFDGIPIVRAQDNYVVQWGDPEGKKPLGNAQRSVAAEFERPLRGLTITKLADPDSYASVVGFLDGFPVAADPALGRAWPVHCYGMVGAGRDNDVDSGGGTELYVVIGQAPRHLDRNVTLLGRVVQGMELLSVTPRGSGCAGLLRASRTAHPDQVHPRGRGRAGRRSAPSLRCCARIPRRSWPTSSARANRVEEWFKVPAGHVDVCNVPVPVRARPAPKS